MRTGSRLAYETIFSLVRFITVLQNEGQGLILIHNSTSYFCKVYFNIILPI